MNIVRASGLSFDISDPGVAALRLVNSERGAKGMTAGVATFQPGARVVLHTHHCEETVIIIEGQAVAHIGGQRFVLRKHDATIVPAELPHCFANETNLPMAIAYFYPVRDAERFDLEEKSSVMPVGRIPVSCGTEGEGVGAEQVPAAVAPGSI